MTLQRMLRDKGISPEEFLSRSKRDASIAWRFNVTSAHHERGDYVFFALLWREQPEGSSFWRDLGLKWAETRSPERWVELETILGWLDPLEAELLEVGDEST